MAADTNSFLMNGIEKMNARRGCLRVIIPHLTDSCLPLRRHLQSINLYAYYTL